MSILARSYVYPGVIQYNVLFSTVDDQGNVHAVTAGTANITVTTTDGGKTATCAVKVKAALPANALPGEFSVSGTKKVHFSQGNLVATIDATGAPTAWKLAANQYDYLGEGGANKTIGHLLQTTATTRTT